MRYDCDTYRISNIPPFRAYDYPGWLIRLTLLTFLRTSISREAFLPGTPIGCLSPLIRYSYDLTNTLQTNLTVSGNNRRWNTRFMWNHHLLSPAFNLEEPRGRSRWIIPLIHGFVDQASERAQAYQSFPADHFLCPNRNSCILAYCLPHTYSKEIPTLCWSSVPYKRSQRACKFDGNSIILVVNCVWLGPCGK